MFNSLLLSTEQSKPTSKYLIKLKIQPTLLTLTRVTSSPIIYLEMHSKKVRECRIRVKQHYAIKNNKLSG